MGLADGCGGELAAKSVSRRLGQVRKVESGVGTAEILRGVEAAARMETEIAVYDE